MPRPEHISWRTPRLSVSSLRQEPWVRTPHFPQRSMMAAPFIRRTDMNKSIAACLLFAIGSVSAQAAMVAKNIDYDVGGKKMQSVLVYDDAVKTPRPGLVIAPGWLGMNPDQVALGKQVAGKDYVVLVADVYGVDVRPKSPDEAGKAAKNRNENAGILGREINGRLT